MNNPEPTNLSSQLPSAMPGAWKLFRLMLWVHWRTFLARVRGIRGKSPLLLTVLAGFIIGYLIVGYWLFHAGLGFIYHFALVGALLSQRIIFVIFSCFFVMLVFSNLIISYSTLFKNGETAWMLTLPVSHRNVYRWKCMESLVVSSWALMFLSAPLMLAFGRVHHVSAVFYGEIAVAYLPFVVIPALLGSWIILALVHVIARPWFSRLLLIVAGCAMAWLVFELKPVHEAQVVNTQEVLAFDRMLHHTRLSQHPLMPGSWLAQTVLACSDDLIWQGAFYFCVLLSNALMGLLISVSIADRFFYGAWSTALSSRAERFHRAAELKRNRVARRTVLEWVADSLPALSTPVRAMVLKDARLFWRDPAQWTQFMIFFGLLCIYVINLRNVAVDFQTVYWETLISYLNLAASALTLSTLTTRFVFPQFSLEGRRLWIVGLAPIGLRQVVLIKFWSSFIVSGILTEILMVLSSITLKLPLQKVLFFCTAIGLLSASLSGLAVGLGALFPEMKQENPSKIVNGFGGTLCLVVSFAYITSFIGLAALPAMKSVLHFSIPLSGGLALVLALGLSLAILFIPMHLALRRLKSLEF